MSFFDALKAKSAAINAGPVNMPKGKAIPAAKPAPQPAIAPLQVTIHLIHDNKRIDVFFDRKPDDSILSLLKSRGFHYRGSDQAWYHKDCPLNRAFLAQHFAATFDSDDSSASQSDDADSSAPVPMPELPARATELALAGLSSGPSLTTVPSTPVPDKATASTSFEAPPIEHDSAEGFSPEYARYKLQVRELLDATKLDAADLMLLAIDTLHSSTFN